MNICMLDTPLSDAERKTAEENHYLVLAFMERNQLDMSEYYDTLIFRYLNAVKRYHQECEHTTDIVSAVNRMLAIALRDLLKKQISREKHEHNASLDAKTSGGYTLLDTLSNGERGVCEQCIDRQEEDHILSILPERLRNILRLRADGYSNREISREVGVSRREMSSLFSEMRMLVSFWL